MWQKFTEGAKRVIFFAQEQAKKQSVDRVDTEHLLLGLTQDSNCVASRLLDRMGASLASIRSEMEGQLAQGDRPDSTSMELTSGGKHVLDLAAAESERLQNGYLGTEHILLGLLGESGGLAGRVLAKRGVELEKTRFEIEQLQDRG